MKTTSLLIFSIAGMTQVTWGITPAPSHIAPDLAWQVATGTRPNQYAELGSQRFAHRLGSDGAQRSQAIGRLAEHQFVADNSRWRMTANPIDPQIDVELVRNGRVVQTGQIKTFRSGQPGKYINAMWRDHSATHFLVPDDHLPALRQSLQNSRDLRLARGQLHKAAEIEKQMTRLRPLGHTYAEYEASMQLARQSTTRALARSAGATAAAGTLAVDGAIVLYQSFNGSLTPLETTTQLGASIGNSVAVGSAVYITVLCGAAPVSIPVIVVGAGVYLVSSYALNKAIEHTSASVFSSHQLHQIMPEGWKILDLSHPPVL